MGYRWIGAVLIVVSCSACGFSVAAGKRKEERLLQQLLQILRFMEAELQYRLTPLPELCVMAAGEARGELHSVFQLLHRELNKQKLPDAGSCMSAVLLRTKELPPRVRRILSQLGYTLGRFDLDGQLLGLRGVQKRCEDALENIHKNRDERLKSYQTLGICAGTALAIVLI